MKKTAPVIFCLLFTMAASAQSVTANRGVLDLREYEFQNIGFVNVTGEFAFYMKELVQPADISKSEARRDLIRFPVLWNDLNNSENPGFGYATYHLRLLVTAPQKFAMELPHFYSSYKLWINGEEISKNGIVGTSKETSVPQWMPTTIVYEAKSDTLDFVIHASNFQHAKGGVREFIKIGAVETLTLKRSIAVSGNIFLFGALIVIAVAFMLIYIFFRQEKAALYFTALAMSWAIRSAFSNLYLVTMAIPDFNWEVIVKIEYITLYLTMIWAIVLMGAIFREDTSHLFKYFFITCNIVFLGFTVLTDASLYTQFLPVYLSFAGILLVYTIYVLVRAVVYEREGVWFIVSCTLLGVIIFAYDIISYEGFTEYNSMIINSGYFGMFLLMAICLAYQFDFLKKKSGRSDMLTYEDLYGSSRK